MYAMQLAATQSYWAPAEAAERERQAQKAMLVADARHAAETDAPRPERPMGLVPRLANALGLF